MAPVRHTWTYVTPIPQIRIQLHTSELCPVHFQTCTLLPFSWVR
jgi:hypothetical protein